MNYGRAQADIIVADSFKELNYKCKKLFLASLNADGDGQKYTDALIKICGRGVYNKIKAQFCDEVYRAALFAELDKRAVACVTLKSESYPDRLKQFPYRRSCSTPAAIPLF